jgi:hypothetical protein
LPSADQHLHRLDAAALAIHYQYFINKLFNLPVHSVYNSLTSLPCGSFFPKKFFYAGKLLFLAFYHCKLHIVMLYFYRLSISQSKIVTQKSKIHGEVSEWLIEQPWKGCVGLVPTAGSNPALSVIAKLFWAVVLFAIDNREHNKGCKSEAYSPYLLFYLCQSK